MKKLETAKGKEMAKDNSLPKVIPHKTLPADKGEYTDLSPMPFGKYQGLILQDVPASYLHYLWTHKPISDKKLENYIERNLHNLKKDYPNGLW
jgi:uncharacterized protein (DUF3820 family)